MKQFIALMSLVLLSPLATATSPIVGPYVQKTIGKLGKAPWGQCRIYPHAVILQTSKQTRPSPGHRIDPKWMEIKIKEASKGELKITALHAKATVPAIRVTAGVFMTAPVDDFTLYLDSSDIRTRSGQASADLLELVDLYCSQLIAE